MREIVAELERLRRRSRWMLVLQRLCFVASWAIGVTTAVILVDYVLRLPSALRLVFLIGAGAALVWGIARYLVPVAAFRPTLTQLALRVEQTMPGLSGRLASSVEFASSGLDSSSALASRSVRDTQARLEGESIGSVMRSGPTFRHVGLLLGLIAVAVTLILATPANAKTGLERLFMPYAGAKWPARTAVASLMHEVLVREGVHPKGQALPLRAENLTKNHPTGRVEAHYRIDEGEGFGRWQNLLLTHQSNRVHERLVDTSAEGIEVYFATEDAETTPEQILFIAPPAVVRATLFVTPPEYASFGNSTAAVYDLGPGLDERTITEQPCLRGSTAVIEFELNKPLPAPSDPDEAWVTSTFGWTEEIRPEFEAADDDLWRITWELESTTRLPLRLEDEFGLTNREPIQYQITAIEDLPPSVTITEPSADQTALPGAIIALAGEAKDDIGVDRIALAVRRQHDAGEPASLPLEAETMGRGPVATVEADLDLSAFELVEGDVVLVHAEAEDIYERDGDRHATVRSPVRRIRIISELDFAAQARRQLSAVRQNAIRIELGQAELQEAVEEEGPQPGSSRAQAELGDRIAEQRESVQELREQLESNRFDDPSLEELMQQSEDLLDYAGRAANKAAEAIEGRQQAGQPGSKSPDEPPDEPRDADVPDPEDSEIIEAQQEVRDELADLIELLDRDEDTWIVQRQLEGLLEAQSQLEAATGQLAEETMGQSIDDLTDAQLSELEQIAQRQRELRDQTRRLIEEMRRRAEALEEIDPQAASGMRSAADTGERREVDRDMETAAQRAEQNQLQSSGAAQQAAQKTLERMNEDLQATRQARAEELLRQLASLIESIDRLIAVQENELIALARSEDTGEFGGRDRAMIRLNQNTEGVAVEARAAGQSSRRIARTLDRASDAQGAAVTALRAPAVDVATVREAEDRSLAMLKEAKTLAEELQEKTAEDQIKERREALMDAYRALAEKQIAVRAQTIVLAEAEALNRRQLVEAHRLGNAQQEIRTGLSDLEGTTREITNSDIFSFVHRLLDQWSTSVSDALWEGTIDVDVTDRQQMIADGIARQIEALEESMSPPDEFADENAAGGGGGGSGPPPPLIPPVAEVKRLHGLQEQIYDQTRSVDTREDLGDGRRRQRVRELGEMQRDVLKLGEELLEKISGGDPAPAEPPPAGGDGTDDDASPSDRDKPDAPENDS